MPSEHISDGILETVSDGIFIGNVQKSGQGDEAANSTDSTARRGNAVLVFVNPL
ncbi:hypothetical protein [Neisseria meningitidis]|uniref:hypothetical protein n=1 Tax=Neisseria meningitidis TaxID=487 RepID=UPI0016412EBA|nr:hypothetical protein [Neisseria meningitidis]